LRPEVAEWPPQLLSVSDIAPRRSGLENELRSQAVTGFRRCSSAAVLSSHTLAFRILMLPGDDAEAIAEAVQRPTMKFVATKTVDQLDLQAMHRVRERLVSQRNWY